MSNDRFSCITPILSARVRELEDEVLMHYPEYRKLQERIIASQERVKNHLPKEHTDAFWDWDASVGEMMAVVSEETYRRGFVDGCRLMKVLRKLVK